MFLPFKLMSNDITVQKIWNSGPKFIQESYSTTWNGGDSSMN